MILTSWHRLIYWPFPPNQEILACGTNIAFLYHPRFPLWWGQSDSDLIIPVVWVDMICKGYRFLREEAIWSSLSLNWLRTAMIIIKINGAVAVVMTLIGCCNIVATCIMVQFRLPQLYIDPYHEAKSGSSCRMFFHITHSICLPIYRCALMVAHYRVYRSIRKVHQ